MRAAWVLPITRTPRASHQLAIISLALGGIIRDTMRPLRTSMVSFAPRDTSPWMMMQPTKPAPICTTRVPGRSSSTMARASASVQQVWTPGRSMPSMFSLLGTEPVAIRRRS
jgi:hypothetical protein